MTRKINFRRILANSLEVFFVTIAGIATANALMDMNLKPETLVIAAVIPALLQFGICFTHEWGKAEEEGNRKPKKIPDLNLKAKVSKINWKNFNKLLSYLVFS